MTSFDEFFADWNVDVQSERYRKLNDRYFDAFEHWLPLQIMPQSTTIDELEKEVDEAITTGVDLTEKYDSEDEPPEDDRVL